MHFPTLVFGEATGVTFLEKCLPQKIHILTYSCRLWNGIQISVKPDWDKPAVLPLFVLFYLVWLQITSTFLLIWVCQFQTLKMIFCHQKWKIHKSVIILSLLLLDLFWIFQKIGYIRGLEKLNKKERSIDFTSKQNKSWG